MRFDEWLLVWRGVLFDEDGPECRLVGKLVLADLVANLVGRNMESDGATGCVSVQVANLIAEQQRRERWVIVHHQSAFTIIDLPPRRKYGNAANAVLFGAHGVLIVVRDLQPPQSKREQQENNKHHVLHYCEFDGRYFFVSSEHTLWRA